MVLCIIGRIYLGINLIIKGEKMRFNKVLHYILKDMIFDAGFIVAVAIGGCAVIGGGLGLVISLILANNGELSIETISQILF